jgi:hypothetical protein
MARSYGLLDLIALFDAVLRRQAESLADCVVRTTASDTATAEYARAAADWQREQMLWLRGCASEFRAALRP